jgi:hypothetical protein
MFLHAIKQIQCLSVSGRLVCLKVRPSIVVGQKQRGKEARQLFGKYHTYIGKSGAHVEHLINWLFFYLKSKLVCFNLGLFE